jgi:hypothetical protein
MIRAFRIVVAVAGLVGGIGFVRAGLWFFRDARGAGGVPTPLSGIMYGLAAMGIGLGLVLLLLAGREMLRLWKAARS